MKSLTQIIIAFIAVNLAIAGSASVEDARQAEAVIAQRQAELAEKTAQRAAELGDAAKQADMALQQVQYSLAPAQARDGAESTTSGLLVLTSQTKAEDLANVTLDLNIMSRILDNKLGRAQRSPHLDKLIGLGYSLGRLGSRGATQTQAMYVQGYAALFFMNVDFPLSPPPEVQVEKVKEGADPVWEQTKRELFLVQGSWFIDEQGTMNNEQKRQYDKDTVEQLKTTLIKALKHAANIRNLKADESVILMASGTEASSLILTIRAKKADIDAYSTGKMTDDQFRQRTAILTSRASAGPERGQIGSWPSQNLRR